MAKLQSIESGAAFMELSGASSEYFDVIVIGGGQAGLSVGYHLKQRGARFVILDANPRIGDAWRNRWDSLRLFSAAWLDGLDGMPFPGDPHAFPTKDEMADYLEAYAAHFELPVRTSTKVECLSRENERFVVKANGRTLYAGHVVVAMATFQGQRVPALASELRTDIVQLHSSAYKNPAQLRPGKTLIVGCGNSGAELAKEIAGVGAVVMAAKDVGEVPFRMTSFWGRHVMARLLMRVVFHRVLTIRTPIGRKARPKMMVKATPLIRVRGAELASVGVERIEERVVRAENGLPVLESGRVLDVQNIVWCTGYEPRQSWIDLPIFDGEGQLEHEAGVVTRMPGLYFVGLPFLYSMSSAMVHGVGRDAARISDVIAARLRALQGVDRPRLSAGVTAKATTSAA